MTQFTLTPSKKKLAASLENEVYVAATIKTPKRKKSDKTPPRDIAVALDVSSSMIGSRLDAAKHTVLQLVEHLNEDDVFTLVTFHTVVQTPIFRANMTSFNKDQARQLIRALQGRLCTNLAGGLYEALAALQDREKGDPVVQRCMLFTDGKANVGDQSTGAILRGLQQRVLDKFPISTFGYGQDYDERLLTNVTQNGGNLYYIADEEEIPSTFAAEFGALHSSFAERVRVKVRPTKEVKSIEVINDLKTRTRNGVLTVSCDDLLQEQSYTVLFKIITNKRRIVKNPQALFEATLSYTDNDGDVVINDPVSVSVGFTNQKEATKKHSKTVTKLLAVQEAAQAQDEARDLAQKRHFRRAQAVLKATAHRAKVYGNEDVEKALLAIHDKYGTEYDFNAIGSKMSSTVKTFFTRQRAGGMSSRTYGGAKLDKQIGTQAQLDTIDAFSITKSSEKDDMPDLDEMITG